MKPNISNPPTECATPSAQRKLADADGLKNAFDIATPLYVLVDPIAGEPLPGLDTDEAGTDSKALREAVWQREITRIPLSERVSLPPNRHPYLVGLQGNEDPLLDVTLELAHSEREVAQKDGLNGDGAALHHIGGWLQSSMHPEQLAEALYVFQGHERWKGTGVKKSVELVRSEKKWN